MARRKPRSSSGSWTPLIALCLVLAGALAADAYLEMHRPLPLPNARTVEVRSGQPARAVFAGLQAGGLLDARQALYLSLWTRLSRPAAGSIRAGEYALEPGLDCLGLLRLLRSGKVVLHEIRFIEGWRFSQVWRALAQDADVAHTIDDPAADGTALMRALGAAGESPEGRFFPDTYRFARGTSEVTILRNAFQAMDRHLADAWAARAPDLAYASPREALIMASLIEKETGNDAERARIAGVFLRRLALHMRLQTDPAVIYGLGDRFDGNLRSVDLHTDTPYNTYTRDGLPPTPICMPGLASIQAALHPAQGKALYFVSRGDGTHQFSETLEEQDAAVRRYQLGGRNGK